MKESKYYSKQKYKTEPMSREEQFKYIKLAQSGNKQAEEYIVEHNLKLVIYVINKYFRSCEIDKDDLFQVGCIGLLKAIKRFDTSLNIVLSTYAVPVIWGEIKRYLDKNNSILKVPTTIQKLLVKIIKLKNNSTNNINLTLEEMSNILNVSELDLSLALNSNKEIKTLSQPIKTNNYSEGKLEDLIPNNEISIEETLIKDERKNILHSLINKLDIKEQLVIKYAYGINCIEKSHKEIAEILNISSSRVSRIKRKVIEELRYYIINRKDIFEILCTENKIIQVI